MEMTSGEILNNIRQISDVDSVYDNLKQIYLLPIWLNLQSISPILMRTI